MNPVFKWVRNKRRGSLWVAPLEIAGALVAFIVARQVLPFFIALALGVMALVGLVILRVRDNDRDDSLELRLRSLLMRQRRTSVFTEDLREIRPYRPED